jgi:hypothetical protein
MSTTLRASLLALTLAGLLLATAPGSGLAAASPVATAPSPPTAPALGMPPALAELTQKMSQLRPSTVRMSLTVGLQAADPKAPGGKASVVMSRVLVKVGIEPALASVTTLGELGGEKVRLVNGEVYEYLPFLDRFDGRRPWVKMSRARYERLEGAQAASSPVHEAGADAAPYASLVAEINGSDDFRELGPSEVDGQAVLGFAMTPRPSSTPRQTGFSAQEEAELQAGLRRLGKSTSTLEVFIAADGLPVRTRATVGSERLAWVSGTDVTATDFPLVVVPPPAKLTIGYRSLRKIETRLTPPLKKPR